MVNSKRYTSRICVSAKSKQLLNTACKEEYRRVHKLNEDVPLSEETIQRSLITFYLGGVDYYNEFNSTDNKENSDNT